MSSRMPGASAASPSIRRVDSSDALKTQVVLQDLTITSSSVTPVRLQRPVPAAERREKDSSPSRDVENKSASRKRTNTGISQVVSPSSLKRRSADLTTSFVLHEGKLSVVEQDDREKHKSFGKIVCRIARLSRECIMELVTSKSSTLKLPLAQMTLIHDHRVPSHSFILTGFSEESSKLMSYTFATSSKDDRVIWVNELRDLTAESPTTHTPSAPTTPHGKEATARHQAREEMTDLATSTPERPIKRGGLVYTVPPKMTHIILVRHGHYINAHAKNVSDADQVLSQMGRQQAELTGKYIEKLYRRCPARHQQVALYHSDLSRAVETATVISKNFSSTNITPVESSLLREGWPGQPFATEQMPAHMLKRDEDEDKELDRLDMERMEQAYNKFFGENTDEDECLFRVVVCHANLIRYFLCRTLGIDPRGVWGHFEINHCGVTRIEICRKRPVKVQAVNETGHLPHSLTTSSEDHL